MSEAIRIDGLRDFRDALADLERDYPRQVQVIMGEAGDLVVDYARPKIPRDSGAAAGSLKIRKSQKTIVFAFGGPKAPWYPWLDFGGEGRRKGRPPARPFRKRGRYLYPALDAKHDDITRLMIKGVDDITRNAGLDVT